MVPLARDPPCVKVRLLVGYFSRNRRSTSSRSSSSATSSGQPSVSSCEARRSWRYWLPFMSLHFQPLDEAAFCLNIVVNNQRGIDLRQQVEATGNRNRR